jgi:hypothetical protein
MYTISTGFNCISLRVFNRLKRRKNRIDLYLQQGRVNRGRDQYLLIRWRYMKYKLLILLFLFSVNKVFSQDNIIELNILNNRIDVLTNEVKTLIKDKNILKIFNSQCEYWLRETNNFRNIREILIIRTKTLEGIINNLDLIVKNASQYNYIDPWYLKMFANDYKGKEIWLFGSLSMHKSDVIGGKITGFDKNRTEIEISLSGPISEAIMYFYRLMINNENKISHFFGQVRIEKGELYFCMDPEKNINNVK